MKIIKTPKFGTEIVNLPYKIEGGQVYVNYFEQGVQAGFPSPADDFKEQKLSLDEKYLTNPDATFLIKVIGDSMYPTLKVGDILIVKSDIEFRDHLIGIVSVNNTDFTVKRLDKANNTLIADNTDFKNITINEDDTIMCLGVVKHLIRDL